MFEDIFVKICGVKSIEELKVVEKYADATGVVVECKSKRRVELDRAKEIIDNSEIPVFAVSTVKTFEEWEKILEKTNAKFVQIHSDINAEVVDKIKETGVYVMKAFKVPKNSLNPEKDAELLINKIRSFKVDRVLLDTGCGSGELHDLRVSKIVSSKLPIILAGGLTPENVEDIIKTVKPAGVDVSSGVEKDGIKNESLIKKFVEQVRRSVL